jgi:hypothetical protein
MDDSRTSVVHHVIRLVGKLRHTQHPPGQCWRWRVLLRALLRTELMTPSHHARGIPSCADFLKADKPGNATKAQRHGDDVRQADSLLGRLQAAPDALGGHSLAACGRVRARAYPPRRQIGADIGLVDWSRRPLEGLRYAALDAETLLWLNSAFARARGTRPEHRMAIRPIDPRTCALVASPLT